MSDSLNANAVLDTDKTNEEVDAGLGSRPTEPDVIHSEAPAPAVTEENVPDPAEQGSDVVIIAALESLAVAESLYASLESAGVINKAAVADIKHRLPGVNLYPENYYTDKPSITHYQASLESIGLHYSVSLEGVLRNVTEDYRNLYARVQKLFDLSDNFARKLKSKVEQLRKDGFDQTELDFRSKEILNVLAPEAGISSASELIAATEDLLSFFEGSIKEMKARSDFIKRVFSNHRVSKEEIVEFITAPPSNQAYGRNNRWTQTSKSTDTEREYVSSKFPGGLQIKHVRPAKVKLDGPVGKFHEFSVSNIGSNPNTDGKLTVPDSTVLLSTLEKLADRIIKLSLDNKVAYNDVPSKAKLSSEQLKKQIRGKLSVGSVIGHIYVNRTHLFFKEPVLVAGAVSRVTKAWLKLVEMMGKESGKVSMESIGAQIDEEFNDLDDIENSLLTDTVAIAPSPIVSEAPSEDVGTDGGEVPQLPVDLDKHEPM